MFSIDSEWRIVLIVLLIGVIGLGQGVDELTRSHGVGQGLVWALEALGGLLLLAGVALYLMRPPTLKSDISLLPGKTSKEQSDSRDSHHDDPFV